MDELIQWLVDNKLHHDKIDNEVVEIYGFGMLFFVDTTDEYLTSVFKKGSKTEETGFNLLTDQKVLINEGIFYVAFKFGDSFYYYDMREKFTFNILKHVGDRIKPDLDIEFVNLGVHSPFELLNGSGGIASWVRKAKHLGHNAIGVCDKNTMASTMLLQNESKKYGLKHVFGYTMDLKPSSTTDETVSVKVYSLTQQGLQNLLRIQKTIMVDSDTHTISVKQLIDYSKGNVIVFGKLSSSWVFSNNHIVKLLQKAFDDSFFQVDLSEYKAERVDIRVLESIKEFFTKGMTNDNVWNIKPILICDQYYLDKDDARNKVNLNKVASRAAHEQSDDQYFKDIDEHWGTFSSILNTDKWDVMGIFQEMCKHTVEIAEKACASYDTSRNFMPQYDMTKEEESLYGTRHNMFVQLLEAGFNKLAPADKRKEYRDRLEYEKYVLESTNNVDYMLVQYDAVNWARANGILVGAGRGSAGGSLVLYLLGITLVDPIKFDLLFERFLLPERAGLYPSDVTTLTSPIESDQYVEVEFENGKLVKFDIDAMFLVKEDDGSVVEIYADELQAGDDIVFDNKDLLWSLVL